MFINKNWIILNSYKFRDAEECERARTCACSNVCVPVQSTITRMRIITNEIEFSFFFFRFGFSLQRMATMRREALYRKHENFSCSTLANYVLCRICAWMKCKERAKISDEWRRPWTFQSYIFFNFLCVRVRVRIALVTMQRWVAQHAFGMLGIYMELILHDAFTPDERNNENVRVWWVKSSLSCVWELLSHLTEIQNEPTNVRLRWLIDGTNEAN